MVRKAFDQYEFIPISGNTKNHVTLKLFVQYKRGVFHMHADDDIRLPDRPE